MFITVLCLFISTAHAADLVNFIDVRQSPKKISTKHIVISAKEIMDKNNHADLERLFKGHPERVLVIDFGESTHVGDNFGGSTSPRLFDTSWGKSCKLFVTH
jgi:hypothetical protein